MATKHKFDDTRVTNAGRKLLIRVGAGKGMITYTRAALFGQDVSKMDDYDMREITQLTDQKMTVPIRTVSTVVDNAVKISATFSNRDVNDDLEFNSVGWFAKSSEDNKEVLLGITPTLGTLTLAAHSPGNVSTESINIDFNMAISNSANVDLTVNQVGVVYQEDLQVELTRVKDGIDKEIADGHYTKQEIDDKLKKIDVSGQIAEKTYDKSTVDTKLSTKANAADVYSKQEIDNKLKNDNTTVTNTLKEKANAADVNKQITTINTTIVNNKNALSEEIATKANAADVYTKTQIDSKEAALKNTDKDLTSRIKYLEERNKFFEENAGLIHKFTNEEDAKAWAAKGANYIGVVDEPDTPATTTTTTDSGSTTTTPTTDTTKS